jgi:hypothetical protein
MIYRLYSGLRGCQEGKSEMNRDGQDKSKFNHEIHEPHEKLAPPKGHRMNPAPEKVLNLLKAGFD